MSGEKRDGEWGGESRGGERMRRFEGRDGRVSSEEKIGEKEGNKLINK